MHNLLNSIGPVLVRSGRTRPAILGVRSCPGWTLICSVRSSPTIRKQCCPFQIALVSFARFFFVIDLAFRMPIGGFLSGCQGCFARSLGLVSAGRYRQNSCVHSPSWRILLVVLGSDFVTSGRKHQICPPLRIVYCL